MRMIGATSEELLNAIGPWPIEDAPGWARLIDAHLLTSVQRAAVRALADRLGWSIDSDADAALWPLLSPAQRALGLPALFRGSKRGLVAGVALAGVEVVSVTSQGLRRRTYVLRREDVGMSPLGEAAPASGAIPLVEVQYRYQLAPRGLVAGEARVLYPTDAPDRYVLAPEDAPVDRWDYLGQSSIDEGTERRRSAGSRAGYLLGVGAAVAGGFADPGPPIRALLGLLAQPHGYDLAAAYRDYDDPTLRSALAAVTGVAWLDADLGGASARQLALAEVAEVADGWTAWP